MFIGLFIPVSLKLAMVIYGIASNALYCGIIAKEDTNQHGIALVGLAFQKKSRLQVPSKLVL